MFKLVVFLLLGAIVNVSVAWGIAIWGELDLLDHIGDTDNTTGTTLIDEGPACWLVMSISEIGMASTFSWLDRDGIVPPRWTEPGPAIDALPRWSHLRRPDPNGGRQDLVENGWGWPWISLSWTADRTFVAAASGQPSRLVTNVLKGIVVERPNGPGERIRALPLRPYWTGFAINTIFYAAILWMLFAPFVLCRAIHRSRRRWLGRCLNCDYDLRGAGHDVCPECGLAVERAILAGSDPRWTKLQTVLSSLAIAQGIVLPIANFTVFQYSLGLGKSWSPQEVLVGFIALWLLGGLIWVSALVVGIFHRRFSQTFLLIMIAVVAETVIAVGMNADTWVELW